MGGGGGGKGGGGGGGGMAGRGVEIGGCESYLALGCEVNGVK